MVLILGARADGTPIEASAILPVPVPHDRSRRVVLQGPPRPGGEGLMSHPARTATYLADPGLVAPSHPKVSTFATPPSAPEARYLQHAPPVGSIFSSHPHYAGDESRALTVDSARPGNGRPMSNRPPVLIAEILAPKATVQTVTSADILGSLVWWGAIGTGIFVAFALAAQGLAAAAAGGP